MQLPRNLPKFLTETDEGWILIYINDILIFSGGKEDLQKLTLRVVKKLQENNQIFFRRIEVFFFFLSQFYCAEELSSYGAHAICRVSNEERRSMYGTNQSLDTL